jgi:hypothetical protein
MKEKQQGGTNNTVTLWTDPAPVLCSSSGPRGFTAHGDEGINSLHHHHVRHVERLLET